MGMKKSEIGMIPEEWNVQSFSDTFRILNNNTFSRNELNYVHGQFRNIHYGDVLILFPEVLDCSREDVPYINDEVRISGSAQPLQDGDVVMADTAEDETVGKVTEVTNTSDKPVMAGLHTIPCRVKSGDFVPKWLGYYMNSHLYHDQLLPYIHGTKVSSVSKGSLGSTVILVPPIAEQKEIVSALSDMDTLIEDLQKLIRKKKDMRQACLQHMFPRNGQKAPDWRLPGFTGDWEQRKLGELGTITTGNTPSTAVPEYYSDDGIVWVTPTDISENIIFNSARKLSKLGQQVGRVVPKNTILVTCIASIGKNTMLGNTGSFNQQINGLTPNENKCDPYFLLTESSLWSAQMKNSAAAGTMQIVNRTEFSELKTLLPNLAEQKQIGSYFRSLDDLITLHQRELEKYKMIKQGMMEELLTGKVRLI